MTTRKGNESIVQKENCFVEEIKEVELRSRRRKFMYNSVEYCRISNVNSFYQCSCKQCFEIALYATCYSVIIHVDTGLQEPEPYLLLLVMGIHCTV